MPYAAGACSARLSSRGPIFNNECGPVLGLRWVGPEITLISFQPGVPAGRETGGGNRRIGTPVGVGDAAQATFDAVARSGVAKVGEPALDGPSQASDHHETRPLGLQPLNQDMVVKPFIGAQYNRSHARRNLCEAGFEKVDRPTDGASVAGPHRARSRDSGPEAEQRMVRPPSLA